MNNLLTTIDNIYPNIIYQINSGIKKIHNIYNNIKDILITNSKYNRRDYIINCLIEKRKSAYGYIWVYKKDFGNITMDNFLIFKKIIHFIRDSHPYLRDEFVESLNPGIIFDELTTGSNIKITCKCKNLNHKPFCTAVNSRTGISNKRKGTNCAECHIDSITLYDRKEKEKEKEKQFKNHISNTDNIDTGDATENYVRDILLKQIILKMLLK